MVRGAAVLTIVVSLIAILQFFGVTKFQCLVSSCSSTSTSQGSKLSEINAVESLVPGVTIATYESKFGQPVFMNKNQPQNSTEYVFVGTYYYLDAVTDQNGMVLYFAVTTRSKTFNPVFKSPGYPQNVPNFKLTLGVTTFSTLPGTDINGTTQYLAGCEGARSFAYMEMDYLGNPGDYESFGFGVNSAGFYDTKIDTSIFSSNQNYCSGISTLNGGDTQQAQQALQSFRSQEIINTYAVSAPAVTISDYIVNGNLGVNPDQVRTLNP